MTDNQTLAAIQEVLLNARIRFTTGTEAEWNTANPVLLDGEIGLVKGTKPLKFKVGDGTTNWVSLGWGNVTSLAQLATDASHRLVTDAEKAKWNGKARVITFNWGAYNSIDPATSNPQKEIVKDIVRSVNAGENLVIFAMDVKPQTTYRETVSGVVTIYAKSSSQVEGVVQDFAYDSNSDGASIYLFTAAITFKSDGTAAIELREMTPELITTEGLPEYSTEKAPTVSGFAATYYLTKGGQRIGVPINIPLDQVLRGSSIKTVTTANSPYTGAKVGDKYIEFLFQNNNTPQYLPVQDLVDVYKGDGTYIQVSASNVIALNYSALKSKLQSDFGSVFDPKGAGAAAAQKAIDDFKAGSFVIQCTIPGMN